MEVLKKFLPVLGVKTCVLCYRISACVRFRIMNVSYQNEKLD